MNSYTLNCVDEARRGATGDVNGRVNCNVMTNQCCNLIFKARFTIATVTVTNRCEILPIHRRKLDGASERFSPSCCSHSSSLVRD